MGRTTRWLRSLLGGKKESRAATEEKDFGEERREKKRWSFKRDSSEVPTAHDSAAWLRTVYSASEREQNKHAIAVAAATAAAADAAVAAAQAAVAVVRLTSHGRGAFGPAQERLAAAAVKIQTIFRGYLAKKALRALKALVKLQALVRGYLVRKQAAATLKSMQALIRAQATIRAQKRRHLLSNDRRLQPPETAPRKSHERFDETRSEHLASVHSRRLSANLDSATSGYDRSPKIVEIDTCRPKSRSSRSRTSPSLVDSAEDMALNSMSSPLQCQIPTRVPAPDCNNFQEHYWCHAGDKWRYSSTAQSTPRYMNPMGMGIAPATPAKSVSAADGGAFRSFFNLPNCPNYMSNTQSFEAKVRSQSTPKQRPEPVVGPGPWKRLPLSEVLLESRASLSGVGMQRSCNRVQEQFNFKSAVVDRSFELGREAERDFYLQRKW